MRKSSRLQERFERQAAELLAIIQMEPRISTAELASRTGTSDGVVLKRLAQLQSEGTISKRGRAQWSSAALPPLSIEERVSNIERHLLKLLALRDADGAP
jgi:DNA-binding GntR family transcriptional regulator